MNLLEPNAVLLTQLTMAIYACFWVYAIFDLIKAEFRDPNQKLIWAIFLVCIPVIGTFMYLAMSRRLKVRDTLFSKSGKKFNFRRR